MILLLNEGILVMSRLFAFQQEHFLTGWSFCCQVEGQRRCCSALAVWTVAPRHAHSQLASSHSPNQTNQQNQKNTRTNKHQRNATSNTSNTQEPFFAHNTHTHTPHTHTYTHNSHTQTPNTAHTQSHAPNSGSEVLGPH